MSALVWSIRASRNVTMNRWWSLNRPVNASVSCSILGRIRPFASSASVFGSRSWSISACSISRADTPCRSETTADNLMQASSSSFSSRCSSRVRSSNNPTRARVRSRSCRCGSGGTNEARINPCAARSASHSASRHIGLATGHALHIRGLHQHHRQRLGQHVEERPPVVAGRLHHRQLNPVGDQLLTQPQDLRHRPTTTWSPWPSSWPIPRPWTRTHTFASRLLTSMPAQRRHTTSTVTTLLGQDPRRAGTADPARRVPRGEAKRNKDLIHVLEATLHGTCNRRHASCSPIPSFSARSQPAQSQRDQPRHPLVSLHQHRDWHQVADQP